MIVLFWFSKVVSVTRNTEQCLQNGILNKSHILLAFFHIVPHMRNICALCTRHNLVSLWPRINLLQSVQVLVACLPCLPFSFLFFFWGVMWVLDLSKFEGSEPYKPVCQWVSQVSQCRDHYHLPSSPLSSRYIPHFLFSSLLLSSPLCLCFFFFFFEQCYFFPLH